MKKEYIYIISIIIKKKIILQIAQIICIKCFNKVMLYYK